MAGAHLVREVRQISDVLKERTRHGEEIIDFLLDVMRNDGEFRHRPIELHLRLRATEIILERGWGKVAPVLPNGEAAPGNGVVFVPVELAPLPALPRAQIIDIPVPQQNE